jgi:hypothetical protein
MSDWVIYFSLTGSAKWREAEALAFLRGQSLAGDPQLAEFALCFPRTESPRQWPGHIERFGQPGLHVYKVQ